MDRKFQQRQEIERLIHLSSTSRSILEDEAILLRNKLDLPARLRQSLKSKPIPWIFGSLATGLVVSLLFKRQPANNTDKKRRSLPLSLLGLTVTAARPFAKAWLTDQLKNYLVKPSGISSDTNLDSQSPLTKNL